MVIYSREEKVIIIPGGEGCGCYSGGQPTHKCEREKAISFQSGWTAGYEQGQADCPECSGGTCNLQEGVVNLMADDRRQWEIYPLTGYDGFSKVIINDYSYGDMRYDEGYSAGYLSGVSTTDCASAITEAFQSGWSGGYQQGQADCSGCPVDFNLEIKFTFPTSEIEEIYTIESIMDVEINGVACESDYSVFSDFYPFGFFRFRVATDENPVSAISFTARYQTGLNPSAQGFTSLSNPIFNEVVTGTVITQSREEVGSFEYHYTDYRYTLTITETPYYDTESFNAGYQAGLAACQNNE